MEQIDNMVEDTKEEVIEDNAEYWAGQVSDVLEQAGEDVEVKDALETLAILDAEHNITDHYDPDELDYFLDEFEEAIEQQEEKSEVFDDHIKEAGDSDKQADDTDKED